MSNRAGEDTERKQMIAFLRDQRSGLLTEIQMMRWRFECIDRIISCRSLTADKIREYVLGQIPPGLSSQPPKQPEHVDCKMVLRQRKG